jgi:hypothetical protein
MPAWRLRLMSAPCKVGDRIELLDMPDDPCPIPVGTKGTVRSISPWPSEGQWQIMVKWDIERSLAMVWPIDSFRIVPQDQ